MRKPDQSMTATVPGAIQPYGLTLDRFIDHAAKWHGATEVVTGGAGASARISYAALRERSRRLSGALWSLDLREGDNLGIMGWNSQAQMECWYGAVGIGIVCHTLNPRLAKEHLAAMIRQAGNRVLVVSPDLVDLTDALVTACPAIEHVILLDEPGGGFRAPRCGRATIWQYERLLADSGEAVAWGQVDENAPAGLCFTSGTTGAPKGITYTHRSNYLHTVHQLQADASGLTANDALLMAVPMFHANGWGFPFSAPAVGAKLVLPGRHQDGASLARLINAEGVTVAAGVPTVWLGLADHLDATGEAVPSLKRVMLGGSAVPQALLDRLEERLGVIVQTSWGMTELSPLGATMPVSAPRRDAAKSGRPPIGVDLLITDAEGNPLPKQRGQEGRLQARGASVVERYFGHADPAVNADGWFDTGDLAVIDEQGNVSITGRAKDLIKSGGEWINPGEIETIVGALPQVAQAAVIGRGHPKWGERPILIVEPRKGAEFSDDLLLDALRPRVARWWLPDTIVRVLTMPLATTGKIDRQRLRADYGKAVRGEDL
ncbi:AMP-binding protein [Stakelama saccharophila]|uniref:AMP-binding protein n=1 Tax=Stakelama saccharophila TaxID=3075605 RepID=A0ABZ0B8J4_9SPHN|nr:AMP-binding protein [Stakelama sp. W311]WNO53752.1 AMP-binding protein [Stakelama sp. W311]